MENYNDGTANAPGAAAPQALNPAPLSSDPNNFNNTSSNQNNAFNSYPTSLANGAFHMSAFNGGYQVAPHMMMPAFTAQATASSVTPTNVWPSTAGGAITDSSATASGKKKSKKRKKPKDKPKRPLSAYNFFFQEERSRILGDMPEKDGSTKGEEEEQGKETTKGKKKKPHGKIGFESLAKTIGKRWKELDEDCLEKYKAMAVKDSERYSQEMEEYGLRVEEVERKEEKKRGVTTSLVPNMYCSQMPQVPFETGNDKASKKRQQMEAIRIAQEVSATAAGRGSGVYAIPPLTHMMPMGVYPQQSAHMMMQPMQAMVTMQQPATNNNGHQQQSQQQTFQDGAIWNFQAAPATNIGQTQAVPDKGYASQRANV